MPPKAGASKWSELKCKFGFAERCVVDNFFSSKDVRLPVQLQRAMAAEAEAAREARAKVVSAIRSGFPRVLLLCLTGDCCRGRTKGEQGVERSGRRHQSVTGCAAAQVPANAEHDLGREEFHHHFPVAD